MHDTLSPPRTLLVSLPLAWVRDPATAGYRRSALRPALDGAALAHGLGKALQAAGLPPPQAQFVPPEVMISPLDALHLIPTGGGWTWLAGVTTEEDADYAPVGVGYGEVYVGYEFAPRAAEALPGQIAAALARYRPPPAEGVIWGAPGAALRAATLGAAPPLPAWTALESRLAGGGGFALIDSATTPETLARLAWRLLGAAGHRASLPPRVTDQGFAVGLDLEGLTAVTLTVPGYATCAAAYTAGTAERLPFDLEGEREALRDSVRGLLAVAAPDRVRLVPWGAALSTGEYGELLYADPDAVAALGVDYPVLCAQGGGLAALGPAWRAAGQVRQVQVAALTFDTSPTAEPQVLHATLYCFPERTAQPPAAATGVVHIDYPAGLDLSRFRARLEPLRAAVNGPVVPVPGYHPRAPEGFILNHPRLVREL